LATCLFRNDPSASRGREITAFDSDGKPLRFGTGFFISDHGKLVTNMNVIEDAKAITAETVSGATYLCEGVVIHPRIWT
jgi:S1-C subfamily serine protease